MWQTMGGFPYRRLVNIGSSLLLVAWLLAPGVAAELATPSGGEGAMVVGGGYPDRHQEPTYRYEQLIYKEPPEQTRKRIEVLNHIDELTSVLKRHYGHSDELSLLMALAAGAGVMLLHGGVTSAVARRISTIMVGDNFANQWGAHSLYGGLALLLAQQVMGYFNIGNPVTLGQRVRYVLESVGAGQLMGLAMGTISRELWGAPQLTGPNWLFMLLGRARHTPGFPQAYAPQSWLAYDHACHYIAGTLLGMAWYYLFRTMLSAKWLEVELAGVEDQLAVNRAALQRLNDYRQQQIDQARQQRDQSFGYGGESW